MSAAELTDSQLAVLLRQTQWALDDAAHHFPAGRGSARRREELAATLEGLAAMVRASVADAPVSAAQAAHEAQVAALRCGRSGVPAMHVVEADADLLPTEAWWFGREKVAMCGAVLSKSTPVPDAEACPGCRDCISYCSACAREVARFATAETATTTEGSRNSLAETATTA